MDLFLFFLATVAIIIACVAKSQLNQLTERFEQLERLLDQKKIAEPKTEETTAPVDEPEPEPKSAIQQVVEKRATPSPPPLPAPVAPVEKEEPVRVPTPAPIPEEEEAAAYGPDWRELLQRIHLWPPSDEDTTEVRLASWWATRLGIVFGVITAVFFAVYNSPDATPGFRLSKLAAVALGFVGLGLWLERKLQAFGQILSAGGLAMLYVTAFAAYAFKPMKVIDDPWIGLAVQLLGVLAMAGFSIWKRSEPFSTAAILLGYVSCWFSHHHGLHSFTLAGLIMLAVVAAALFLRFRWVAPFAIAMAGGYIGYALLVPFRWSVAELGSPGFVWILPAALMLMGIFHFTLHGYHLLRGGIEERWRIFGVLSNTSAALAVGLIATATVHPDSLSSAYLLFGIALAALTGLEFWKPRSNRLTSVLFLKSMAAFALFAIYRWAGPAEWLAVAMQSLVLAIALKWSRSRAMECGGYALWIAAFWLFARDIYETWPLNNDAPFYWGAERTLSLLFVLIQVLALSFHRGWVAEVRPRNAPARNYFISVLAIASGVGLSLVFLIPASDDGWQLLAQIGAALAISAVAFGVRTWPALVAGGAALVIATVRHLYLPYPNDGLTSQTLIGGLLLLGAALAATELATWLWRASTPGREWVRLFAMSTGLLAFLSLFLHASFDASPLLVFLVWTPMLPLILILSNRWRDGHASELPVWQGSRWFIAAAAGLIMLSRFWELTGQDQMLSIATFLAAAIALAACLITKHAAAIATAAPLFVVGTLGYLVSHFDGGAAPLGQVALLAAIPIAIAVTHRWLVRDGAWGGSKTADTFLHLLWMLIAVVAVEEHLPQTWSVAASCGLALAVYAIGLKLPFFTLRHVTLAPLAFATIYSLGAMPMEGPLAGLWLAFAAGFTLTLAEQALDRRVWFGWLSGLLTLALGLIATFESFDSPWDQAALGALGLAYFAVWRFVRMPSAAWTGGIAFAFAIIRHVQIGLTGEPTMDGLIASIALAVALIIAGLLLVTAPHEQFENAQLRKVAGWIFPIFALFVFLPAIAWPGGPGAEYATAWWGAAGSVVFLCGLILRVQAYRITGLIGIGLGIIRMFIVDIDDTFGRIVAFGAVAAVLLVVGFLYARFREFIERGERW